MKKKIKITPAIFPMPVLMIATYNEDGSVDVMNAAWGCAYDFKQIKLNISDSHKTAENIRRTGAFTVSLADEAHVAESDYLGIVSANGVKNKFENTGLHAYQSELVNAPIIEEYPVCMECKALPFDGEYGVLGEIVNLTVDEDCFDDDGKVDITKLKIICYDTFNHGYYSSGERKVGQAFSEGKKLLK